LTVTWPSFSSTLTTVATVGAPLLVNFTLSPALSAGWATGLDSVAGLAAGAGEAWLLAFVFAGPFVFVSVATGSQAAMLKHNSSSAKIVLVMILSPPGMKFSFKFRRSAGPSFQAGIRTQLRFEGEWDKLAKRFNFESKKVFP